MVWLLKYNDLINKLPFKLGTSRIGRSVSGISTRDRKTLWSRHSENEANKRD